MLKIIELFAGVGSQTQALKNIGVEHEVVAISEIDKYAIDTYQQLHGQVNNLGDITKIERLPIADLWTYSFPCQDLSVAGKGAGIKEGTRSGLLLEVERLLDIANNNNELPKYLLLENVKNLIGKKNKPDFDIWLNKLEQLGYTNYWQVLNAKDYGIPQNRERVFVVSILGEHTPYIFPQKQELTLRLKDMLEDKVDEKYYLSDEQVRNIKASNFMQEKKRLQEKDVCDTLLARDYKDPKCIQIGCIGSNSQGNRVYDKNGLATTQSAQGGGWGAKTGLYIVNGTKQGYIEAFDGDSVNLQFPNSKTRRGRVGHQVAQTIDTHCNQAVVEPVENNKNLKKQLCDYLIENEKVKENDVIRHLRIRKLTPRECWRLMGWKDEQFDKAKYEREILYLEGDENICNAKLKVVKDKQEQLNTETYALCTIKDLCEQGQTLIEQLKNLNKQELMKMQNVSFAIEKLEGQGHLECVTNTTKCIDFMGMHFILMEEKDQHYAVIIAQVNKDKANTEKYLKITTELNLNQVKLYIILTLIAQIIKLKIFTSTTLKANIQGYIANIEDYENDILMKNLSLKVNITKERMSNSALYKMAGNGIVVNVLEAIFMNLFKR